MFNDLYHFYTPKVDEYLGLNADVNQARCCF